MTEQYTPNDGDVRWQYVVKRMHDGATRTHAEQEYTRWLAAHDARVRRDAALALAEHFSAEAIDQARQGNLDGADFNRAVAAEIEKQIPEETP